MSQPVRRGASPSKAVRTIEETVRMARKRPGTTVLYSEGHARYGARVKANDIRTGRRGTWKDYVGEVSTSAIQQADGTYNVFVYIHPDDLYNSVAGQAVRPAESPAQDPEDTEDTGAPEAPAEAAPSAPEPAEDPEPTPAPEAAPQD